MAEQKGCPDTIEALNRRLVEFAQARDWEQFHDAKNLPMALIGEAGELIEHFQWLTPEQSMNLSAQKQQEVAYELADILIYTIRIAERLDIDLLQAARDKMDINERRYPADKVRGDARRADEYED